MGQYVTVLLATFTNNDYLDSVVRRIYKCFQVENERLFIFSDIDNEQKKIITYNVLVPANGKVEINKVNNTIRINRKKESNTLYTINALNKVIQKKIGRVDPGYNLDWSEFRNTLMISDKEDEEVTLIRTAVYHVLDRNTFFKNDTAHIIKRINNNNPQYF